MGMCKTFRNRAESKIYLGVKGTSLEDADAKSKALSEAVHAMIGKML